MSRSMKPLADILEFDKIKEQILKYNINALSRKKLMELKPFFVLERVQEELNKTQEGYQLKTLGLMPNLASLIDVEPYINQLQIGSVLQISEIYDFFIHLQIIKELKEFKKSLDVNIYPFTCQSIQKLFYFSSIADQIQYCIAPNLTLYDHASSMLKSIKKKIQKCEEEIKNALNNLLKKYANDVTDYFVASKNNRLVLPIKATSKNKVKGMVIDISETGQTYYIEPQEVIELNLQLEALRYEQLAEEKRIIKALCQMIVKEKEGFLQNNEILKEISFLLLKGTYGVEKQYEIATLNDSYLSLIQAKHPLIDSTKVISNDYVLGKNGHRILVISGPNAGGKTVSIKTVALLVYMNQCGLPLPVKEASLKVFSHIFADIGDEQSIEESLSGFSSHMANVSYILKHADANSLVIFDELGSKTDPKEGEALAKAILDDLDDKKMMALVTTHYVGVKDFAKTSSSILLSSMSFDEKTMTPTYKLILHVVGRSYALEISKRLGIPSSIIKKAQEYKDKDTSTLEQLIDSMNQQLKLEAQKLKEIENQENEVKEIKLQLQQEKQQLQNQQQKILEQFEKKQEELFEDTKQQIEQLIAQLQNTNKENFKLHQKNAILKQFQQLQQEEKTTIVEDQTLKIGDNVYVESLHNYGKIQEIKNHYAMVAIQNTSVKVSLKELKKVDLKQENKKSRPQVSKKEILQNVPTSINVVGYHVEDALRTIHSYLDQALLVNYPSVTIIHGIGTGTLKKAIQEDLKQLSFVKSYRSGVYGEGGMGVTIVNLK